MCRQYESSCLALIIKTNLKTDTNSKLIKMLGVFMERRMGANKKLRNTINNKNRIEWKKREWDRNLDYVSKRSGGRGDRWIERESENGKRREYIAQGVWENNNKIKIIHFCPRSTIVSCRCHLLLVYLMRTLFNVFTG